MHLIVALTEPLVPSQSAASLAAGEGEAEADLSALVDRLAVRLFALAVQPDRGQGQTAAAERCRVRL
jgi:hypothetical protein